MLLIYICFAIIIFLIVLEFCSRIYYKKRFKIKWITKDIGEYPFDKCVEKVEKPLYFRFKKNFKSKMLNINGYGMRGEEPSEDGKKKRIMIIGESIFFGSKLPEEKDLWNYKLAEILNKKGIKNWEILNAGFPGYNAVQIYEWWKNTLKNLKPDILIFQCGANDITQAYVFGDKWKEGMPWPWEFILNQQRRSKWWQKILYRSCMFFIWRRKNITERKGFESRSGVVDFEKCREVIFKYSTKIIKEAKNMGTKVILVSLGSAYDKENLDEDIPQLDAIQSNWRESLATTGIPMIDFFNQWWLKKHSEDMNCETLDLYEIFRKAPNRYEMFIDVFHLNKYGHELVARAIFNKITELNWW